jgi:Cft2 family RNA processing exonuclease
MCTDSYPGQTLLLKIINNTSFGKINNLLSQGRDIVQGRIPAKAVIHPLTGYSAHADQKGLCEWVKSMPELPGEIRLVHGEPEAQKALRSKLNLL